MTNEVAELRRALADSKRRERDLEDLLERERRGRRTAAADAAAKATILTVLGRELRAPLNTALGWYRFVRRELLSQSGREHALAIAERNLAGIAQLVDDLLVLAEIEPDRAPAIESIALADVLSRVQYERVSVKVVEPIALQGDAARLTRLLDRFFITALAEAQGAVDVTVTAEGMGVTICAVFAPSPTRPSSVTVNWDTLSASSDTGPSPDLEFFITQKLAAAQGGSLQIALESKVATMTMTLPVVPEVEEREPILVEHRSACRLLSLSLDSMRRRVGDAADEIPRAWLLEQIEGMKAAVARLDAWPAPWLGPCESLRKRSPKRDRC